mmetsp:Transcript_16667/g.45796  ORF Transcript_16667/g.45796 Transcript_16667/m.45796 type:complete len:450 (-) Transcript_16667:617-1966(-)
MAQVVMPETKTSPTSSPLPNATENSTSGGDLFSPTSAAAWALSTLHNFGAAAPNDNGGLRPTAGSLTGTRLFKSSGEASADSTTPPNITSAPNQIKSTAIGASGSSTQPTSGVSWGENQFQHPNHSNFVDPSPLVVRTNGIPASGSAPREKPLARMMCSTSMVTPTPKKLKVDGNAGSAAYSRKKKSLGVLAENFINHYSRYPPGAVVIVDHAAVDLGVERRRIYDVVNILESVNLVEKKQKNTYSWMGMDHFDDFFGKLQAKAVSEYPEDAKRYLDDSIQVDESLKNRKSKENKSLAKLSEEFLQVFLVGFETLSLPEASDKIQGTTSMEELIAMGGGARGKSTAVGAIPDARELKAAAARGLKTKIRRLYDIANVFLSVGLLKKVENIDTSRRPNFSWNYKLSAKELYNRHRIKAVLSTETEEPAPDARHSASDALCSAQQNTRKRI